MRSNATLSVFHYAIFFILLLLSTRDGYAQQCAGNQMRMSVENVTATANTLEFDIFVENTGSTTLRLAGCQGNVRYNEGLLPAGAIGTFTVITQPSGADFPTLNNMGGVTHTVASRQLRWIETPTTLSSGNTVLLPSNTPMKFARFRFTSTLPWTTDALAAFDFSTLVGPGITTNLILAYCNSNISSCVIAEENGNILFRGSNLVAISSILGTSTVSNWADAVAFPNPFSGGFELRLPSTQQGVVTVAIYDAIGRLIEQKPCTPTQLIPQQFGSSYLPGIYNVIVSAGTNRQSLRVIKQ